jgi:hypothetical protein
MTNTRPIPKKSMAKLAIVQPQIENADNSQAGVTHLHTNSAIVGNGRFMQITSLTTGPLPLNPK